MVFHVSIELSVLLRGCFFCRFSSLFARDEAQHMAISQKQSWRRRGDSNSRCRSPHTNDLANRPLQPLGYSSSVSDCALTCIGYCSIGQAIALDICEIQFYLYIAAVSLAIYFLHSPFPLSSNINK